MNGNPVPFSAYTELYIPTHTGLGEIPLFDVPPDALVHKVYAILRSNTTGDTYSVLADILFKWQGKVISRVPCNFSNDTTIGLRTCLFPNTANSMAIARDAILLQGWATTDLFLFPRRIGSLAGQVALDVRRFSSSGVADWKGFFAVESSNVA